VATLPPFPEVSRSMPLSRSARFLLLPALALVAACGGQDPSLRAGGVPVVGLLVLSSGPGTAEIRAGQLVAARGGFESVVRGNPERMDALNDLAVAYHLEGHSEAARQLLDEVVARGTPREQQAALVNLADIYAGEGFLQAAQAHVDAAREIDTGRPEPAWAQALLADARGDADAPRLAAEALRLDADGSARRFLVFDSPEERAHFEALSAEASGDRAVALGRWRELRAGRVPSLVQLAQRHLGE
jgi:tetratricopeptide (TPR) repeat protein